MPRKKQEEINEPVKTVDETAPLDESKITVEKKDLDALLKKLDSQAKDIKTLYEVADKGRLESVRSKEQGPLVSTFKVWTLDGKIVVAHKMISNTAEVINGRYFEDQRLTVYFEDGKSEEMTYLNFARRVKKTTIGEEVGRESDVSGEEVIKLILNDGREIKINKKFLN